MNRWLDRIQIWRGGSLGTSDDLLTFRKKSFKNKMTEKVIKKLPPEKPVGAVS